MRAWAWPARLAVVAVIVAALAVDQSLGAEPDTPPPAPTPAGVPTAAVSAEPVSSTWYCAVVRSASSEAAGGVAVDAQLVLANRGTEDLAATISYVAPTSEDVSRVVEVAAGSSVVVDPADDIDAAQVAALVEAPGGDLVVERRLVNQDSETCAAAPHGEWYLAGGDTSVDAVTSVVILNPFPSDAVVDLVFASEAEPGPFTVLDLEGFVVPARSVLQVDLTEAVRRRTDVATALVARSGSVVVDRLVSFDGSEGRAGLSLALGAPATATRWVWPGGRIDDATQMQVHIFNPGDEGAEVDVAPQFGSLTSGVVAVPAAVSVPAHDEVTIDVVPFGAEGGRPQRIEVTPGRPFGLVVESADGVPVVVDIEVANRPSPTTTTTAPPTTTTTAPPTTTPPTTTTTAPPASDTTGADDEAAAGTSTTAAPTTAPPTTAATTATSAPGGAGSPGQPGRSTTTAAPPTTTATTTTTTTVVDPAIEAIPERRAEGGADLTLAASRLGQRWLVIAPRGQNLVSRLVIHNPASAATEVRVDTIGPGGRTPLTEIEVEALASVEVPLEPSLAGTLLVTEASGPVAVGVVAEVDDGVGLRTQLGWLLA